MDQMERLKGNCEKLKALGVVDIKVTWHEDAPKHTPEDRARSLSEALEAIERGECTEMEPLGDSGA